MHSRPLLFQSLTISRPDSGGNVYKNVLKEVLDALDAREDASFFAQFDGDNDNEVDMITFIHSGYAGEGTPGNDDIGTSDLYLDGIADLNRIVHSI